MIASTPSPSPTAAPDPAPEALAVPAPKGGLRMVVRLLRPRQWTKNGAVLAALVFARRLLNPADAMHAAMAMVAFCGLSSSVYIFNDLFDKERDQLHPEKRNRPIASGAISPGAAVAVGALLCISSLTLAWFVALQVLWVCLVYVFLQALYTPWLKQVVILDVMIIALGFVLRVIAGASAIHVPVSNWLYLCTLCLALFLGFCKRRNELLLLDVAAAGHRANLMDYSGPLLDQIIGITTAMTMISYSLYTMSDETIAKFHSDNLKLTIPFVIYGVFRYLFLVYRRDLGGSPEKILLSDVPLILTIVGYVGVVVGVLYQAWG